LASRWYVLSTKLNKEEILLKQLESQGYEVFYPRYILSNGKSKRINVKAYFPGYLFVHLDLSNVSLSTFQWMPNAEGLVCFETRPAYVPDALVHAIRKHVDKINITQVQAIEQALEESDRDSQRNSHDTAYPAILNSRLSSGERVQELLRMLQW
jgi:transcriptional antiterminator RfaH